MNRHLKVILVFASVVAISAFTAIAMAPNTPVRQVGPYIFTQNAFDSTAGGGVGGTVKVYVAADSEWIGMIVHLDTLLLGNTRVDTIATNYNGVAGVVVGGQRTSMLASTSVADTSTLAATAGQKVIVLVDGRAWVLVDSAATFRPGRNVMPSNKQGQRGRLMVKPAALDSFSRLIGHNIDSARLGKAVLVDVRIR